MALRLNTFLFLDTIDLTTAPLNPENHISRYVLNINTSANETTKTNSLLFTPGTNIGTNLLNCSKNLLSTDAVRFLSLLPVFAILLFLLVEVLSEGASSVFAVAFAVLEELASIKNIKIIKC